MAREVKLPSLGENVAEGDVVDVKVKPGDEVKEGQPLLEVEAEKSAVEVPAPFSGRVAQVAVKKGDKVKTGQVLVTFDGEGAANAKSSDAKPAEKKAPPKPEAKNDKTPKSEKPDHAPATTEPRVEARTDVAKKPTTPPSPAAPPTTTDDDNGPVVPAGPATRRLANEWGVDLAQVAGSGPRGRVVGDDVKQYVRQIASSGPRMGSAAAPPLPNFEEWGQVEYKPLDSVRRKTAEHMAVAWSQIPHVTHHDLADVGELEAFRKRQEGKGPKLTVTAFALKAVSVALREFPRFNSSLDLAQDQLILKNYCHVGVAVDTERGLLVPVLRDVDKKSINELAVELAEVAERARQKKLTAQDMKGGCFTISNLGSIGGIGFSPIINYPEVAILGMSRARMQPVWKNEQWVPRPLLPLSLSYDHRVIDGADAARFTRRLADLLENPLLMLLQSR